MSSSASKPSLVRSSCRPVLSISRSTSFSPLIVGSDETRKLISLPAGEANLDRAVLRQAPLGDVERGHDLDARGERRLEAGRRLHDVVEDAVDAEADAEVVLEGLDVDVARPPLDRVGHQRVDELDERSFLRRALQLGEVDRFLVAHDLEAALAVEVPSAHRLRFSRARCSGGRLPSGIPACGREHDADVAACQELALVERRRDSKDPPSPSVSVDPVRLIGSTSCLRASGCGNQREHLRQRLDAQRIDDRKSVLLVKIRGDDLRPSHEPEPHQRRGELPAVPFADQASAAASCSEVITERRTQKLAEA